MLHILTQPSTIQLCCKHAVFLPADAEVTMALCIACSPEICNLHPVTQYGICSPPHLLMHRCQLHGTASELLCPNACTHSWCFILDMCSMACQTDMLGRIDRCCTNSEHVKVQTIQTQAASKPGCVRRICLTNLDVVLSKANKVTVNMLVYKQCTSKKTPFGFLNWQHYCTMYIVQSRLCNAAICLPQVDPTQCFESVHK